MFVHDPRKSTANLHCTSMKYPGELRDINTCPKAGDCGADAQDLKLRMPSVVTYANGDLLSQSLREPAPLCEDVGVLQQQFV